MEQILNLIAALHAILKTIKIKVNLDFFVAWVRWPGQPCTTDIIAGVSHGYVIYPRGAQNILLHGYPIPVGPLQ